MPAPATSSSRRRRRRARAADRASSHLFLHRSFCGSSFVFCFFFRVDRMPSRNQPGKPIRVDDGRQCCQIDPIQKRKNPIPIKSNYETRSTFDYVGRHRIRSGGGTRPWAEGAGGVATPRDAATLGRPRPLDSSDSFPLGRFPTLAFNGH